MRRLLLLLASSSIAMAANAQERVLTGVTAGDHKLPAHLEKNIKKPVFKKHAAKTTAAPDRVYSYGSYFDTIMNDNFTLETDITAPLMWQDDKIMANFTSGLDTIQQVSMAVVFDPSTAGFNSEVYYLGEMKIRNSDAYIAKGVNIFGYYSYNHTNTSVVDTLVLSFVTGKGGAPSADDIFINGTISGGHYGSLDVLTMRYDTTELNYARTGSIAMGTPSDKVVKIPLTAADSGDYSRSIDLAAALGGGGLSVPAGNFIGMSISFKSGYSSIPPYATLLNADGTFNYNVFRPLVIFASDASGNPQWAPYSSTDSNTGYFKTLPHDANGWSYVYVPQWAWSATGGTASALQMPYVEWNLNCATCGNVEPVSVNEVKPVSEVNVYPNPANNEVKINFKGTAVANTTITLTNMLGQVVAEANMGYVASGTANFNTANLATGVYTYTISANGQRTTGRISVAH